MQTGLLSHLPYGLRGTRPESGGGELSDGGLGRASHHRGESRDRCRRDPPGTVARVCDWARTEDRSQPTVLWACA